MADIKQAAEWMQEGYTVTRPKWPNYHLDSGGDSVWHRERNDWAYFDIEDLLADDWEIEAKK